jgi:hypothetical protein
VQAELPVWLTVAANPEGFEHAGRHGLNVLTALLTLTVEELGERLLIYRKALRAAGHNPDTRVVTVMLHTLVAESDDEAIRHAYAPLVAYFHAHTEMREQALRNSKGTEWQTQSQLGEPASAADVERLVRSSVERYLQAASLIGSPASALRMVSRLKSIGVTEIACLIDFGIHSEVVLEKLDFLAQLARDSHLALDTGSLRAHLKELVPDYMVPSEFVPLRMLPLTATGKIDRQALLALPVDATQTAKTAPRTPVEKALAAIWMGVLKVEQVGIHDDFFEIGGHSLAAVRVAAQVREEFGVNMPLWTMFRARTLIEMAEAVVATMIGADAPSSPSTLESLSESHV